MKYIEGEIVFNTDTLDVTDPCYDKDVWCRMTVPIAPGKFNYRAELVDYWGERVSALRIVSADIDCIPNRGRVIGNIGVDAGLAGFFDHKPDYDDDKWAEICEFINHDENCYEVDEKTPLGCVGVFSSSGIGDGGYNVYELLDDNGYRCGYEIEFLEDA